MFSFERNSNKLEKRITNLKNWMIFFNLKLLGTGVDKDNKFNDWNHLTLPCIKYLCFAIDNVYKLNDIICCAARDLPLLQLVQMGTYENEI